MTDEARWQVVSTSPSFGKYFHAPLDLLVDGGCEVSFIDSGDDRLTDALGDADAWIVGFDRVDASSIEAFRRLRVVAKCGVGLDNFDLPYLKERGIEVVNVPGGNAGAVAEYALAQILALTREVLRNDAAVRDGAWSHGLPRSLEGKVLGIIGFGSIGRRLAGFANALGMSVLAYDINVASASEDHVTMTDVATLLNQSDVVSVHVPLTEQTKGLIGAEELKRMKPEALLVNNSRGGIVDEAAVDAALRNGTLAGAAFDVFGEEPLPPDSPLRTTPNMLLSAHLAGYSDRALEFVTHSCATSVLDALRKQSA